MLRVAGSELAVRVLSR